MNKKIILNLNQITTHLDLAAWWETCKPIVVAHHPIYYKEKVVGYVTDLSVAQPSQRPCVDVFDLKVTAKDGTIFASKQTDGSYIFFFDRNWADELVLKHEPGFATPAKEVATKKRRKHQP